MVPRVCQFTEILLRFYGAPSISIYRDFTMPWVCQFTEILGCFEYVNLQRFSRDFMVPRVCQFTEILWCPICHHHHDQAKHVKSLQLVNLQTYLGDFVKSVNNESYPLSQAATIYKHFTNILKWTKLKTKRNVSKISLQSFCLFSRISTKSVSSESRDITLSL